MDRFSFPSRLTAEYRMITPMFIGGADKKPWGVSPQSFKGVLRFWWRAQAWPRISKANPNNEADALRQLHKEESILFGTAADNESDIGRGLVSLRIEQPDNLSTVSEWPENKVNNPSHYLGMGLVQSGNKDRNTFQAHREAIKGEQNFTVHLLLDNEILKQQKEELILTLKLIGAFGGLGGRSRRGFGSIQLSTLSDGENNLEKLKFSKSGLAQYIKNLLASMQLPGSNVASYTAFSKEVKWAICSESFTAQASKKLTAAQHAHSDLGGLYKDYRKSLEGKVTIDAQVDVNKPHTKLRSIFGFPLLGVSSERRASPMFFHITELEDKTCTYVALYLPSAIFHMQNKKVDEAAALEFLDIVSN